MKSIMLTAVIVGAALAVTPFASAQETTQPQGMAMPDMPKPQKEHEWLKQLAGEWTYEVELHMAPDTPPMKASGKESTRQIGGFWTITETSGEMMGSQFQGVMTLGYSPDKKKYVGTWIDNMTGMLWDYEGTVDESGKKLVLSTEGPCPMQGGKIVNMRETIEITGPDTKTMTSEIDFDGKWVTGMKMTSTRKK